MTGFGAAHHEGEGLGVRVEARAVNHRHLQVKSRLPHELGFLEPELEALVRKRLHRGTVSLNVAVTRHESAADVELDTAAAQRYRQLILRLGRELGVPGDLQLRDLVALPGVLVEREGSSGEAEAKLVLKVAGEALAQLVTMREREGEKLAAAVAKQARSIERLVARIARKMPAVVKAHHEALRARVRELLDGQSLSEVEIARELALLADRLDVTEELARLESHVSQLDRVLEKGGSVGRSLDFLAQEFFREANTIGSKCNDARVAHLVVELKTHIERMREQIQNLE